MKKIVFVLGVLPLLMAGTSCIKDNGCQDRTIQSEVAAMDAFAIANGINGTTHTSGIVYDNYVVGTGDSPTLTSTVSVRYTGKLLNGTVFDSQVGSPVTFQVGGTIAGFQLGLQLMKEGGKQRLIIPSVLAYGCRGSGPIPSNSILYFDVELVDVQ